MASTDENGNGRSGALPRSEFWMRIAGACFALWALMIPAGISIMRSTLGEAAANNARLLAEFSAYKLEVERRLSILEERQRLGYESLARVEQRLNKLDAEWNFQRRDR